MSMLSQKVLERAEQERKYEEARGRVRSLWLSTAFLVLVALLFALGHAGPERVGGAFAAASVAAFAAIEAHETARRRTPRLLRVSVYLLWGASMVLLAIAFMHGTRH